MIVWIHVVFWLVVAGITYLISGAEAANGVLKMVAFGFAVGGGIWFLNRLLEYSRAETLSKVAELLDKHEESTLGVLRHRLNLIAEEQRTNQNILCNLFAALERHDDRTRERV
jgi:hypothetical protein